MEVRAPSRVSAEMEEGGKGGAWSSDAAALAAESLRLRWIEEVAETEAAEWEGEGVWELRERFWAAR